MHRYEVERLVAKAMQRGLAQRETESTWTVDYAGKCHFPVRREIWSAYDREKQADALRLLGNRGMIRVFGSFRCRRCEWCLMNRRIRWKRAAEVETKAAVRTWFGTLTLAPSAHMRVLAECRASLSRQGIIFDALEYREQFALRHRQCSKLLTDYLKRVREQSQSSLRYLLVCEAHKSGLPHYHLLIHEQSELQPVRKVVLQNQWTQGFSAWKLVTEPAQATYLCKYLAKTSAARVRSSLHYGEQTESALVHSEEMRAERVF